MMRAIDGIHAVEVDYSVREAKPGDRFLLCSDGLNDGLWDAGLDDLIRHPPAAPEGLSVAQHLVRAAVGSSGRDNCTAVVIEIGSPEP